jgi:hypothetical protein
MTAAQETKKTAVNGRKQVTTEEHAIGLLQRHHAQARVELAGVRRGRDVLIVLLEEERAYVNRRLTEALEAIREDRVGEAEQIIEDLLSIATGESHG